MQANIADQVELSIQCPQPELVAYLEKNDILPQAYSPLGGTDGQKLREDPTIVKIAEKHGVHGATILISWLIKRGICVLPKSVTPSRIEANAKSTSSPLLRDCCTDQQPLTFPRRSSSLSRIWPSPSPPTEFVTSLTVCSRFPVNG